jgi:hypothetical protein
VTARAYPDKGHWFAAAGLLAVFMLDRASHAMFGDVTVAPLVAVIALAAIALRLKPGQILLWTLAYALLCFLLLTYWRGSFVSLPKALPEDFLSATFFGRAAVRSTTVLVAGALCALLSRQRQKLQIAVDETTAVMAALPSAVLISDPSGFISFANDKAADTLRTGKDELMGASFFSLITSPEGNTIEKYSSLIELPSENSGVIKLQLRRNPDMRFSARMFCLQTSAGRMIATVLTENDSSP